MTIPKKYLKFFVRNYGDSRYVILQGGRRSGKTYSTLQWLFFLCSGMTKLNVMIAAASAAQLQATIQDFQDCLGFTVTGSKVLGDHCIMPNGSVWQFKNFDEYEKAVGQKCDILFLNEAVNMDESTFATLVQGVRHSIYLNYNPTRKCWVNKHFLPDGRNLLITTWKDNPYLTESQREEFEEIKNRALRPDASLFDKYNYEVFYKGNFTNVAGKVFKSVYSCTDEEFESIKAPILYGLDFGFIDGNDSTTVVGIKILNNILYTKQYICSKQLGDNKALALELNRLGFDCYTTIVADYGGLGKERIKCLTSANNGKWTESSICRGFNIVNAKKGKVVDGIQRLLQFDKIVVTEESVVLKEEMERYELDEEGKEKSKHQNTVDALRYANNSYHIFCYSQ